jgi:hypothetical protein
VLPAIENAARNTQGSTKGDLTSSAVIDVDGAARILGGYYVIGTAHSEPLQKHQHSRDQFRPLGETQRSTLRPQCAFFCVSSWRPTAFSTDLGCS